MSDFEPIYEEPHTNNSTYRSSSEMGNPPRSQIVINISHLDYAELVRNSKIQCLENEISQLNRQLKDKKILLNRELKLSASRKNGSRKNALSRFFKCLN
jgi:hypothetical protein